MAQGSAEFAVSYIFHSPYVVSPHSRMGNVYCEDTSESRMELLEDFFLFPINTPYSYSLYNNEVVVYPTPLFV